MSRDDYRGGGTVIGPRTPSWFSDGAPVRLTAQEQRDRQAERLRLKA